jgi:hypothetical protein
LSKEAACIPEKKRKTALAILKDRFSQAWGWDPLYRRVRTLLDRSGLLSVGDCEMAALETRAEIAANGDLYLTRLLLTGEVAARFAAWVEAALTGEAVSQVVEIRREEELIATGYELERSQSAVVEGTERAWIEQVQIIRLESAAGGGARPDAAAGPGRRPFTTGWELERAVAAFLAGHDVAGLLEVSWERQATSRTKYIGRGRDGPNRPRTTEWDIRYQITTVGATSRRSRTGWSGWAGRCR